MSVSQDFDPDVFFFLWGGAKLTPHHSTHIFHLSSLTPHLSLSLFYVLYRDDMVDASKKFFFVFTMLIRSVNSTLKFTGFTYFCVQVLAKLIILFSQFKIFSSKLAVALLKKLC